MSKHIVKTTKSPYETQQLAKKVLENNKCNIICLHGPLGSGKTTFTQGLAKAIGVNKKVISPSFILQREYKPTVGSFRKLYHLDFYRLNSYREIKAIDLSELWSDKNNLVVIEWADKIKEIIPPKRIEIEFSHVSESERKLIIKKHP